jgi:hypothetical protein
MRIKALLVPIAVTLTPAMPAVALDFGKDIRPIFEERCMDCHDMETKKGGVSLENYYSSQQPTDTGQPLFKAGDAEHSLLIHVTTESDAKKRMPPKGKPLSPDQISLLKQWIAQGAVWPDDGWRPQPHWAYKAPQLPTVPQTQAQGARNEIDAFIDAQLASKKLQRSSEAEPALQLRRVFLDLTGLPPTVAQVDAFLANPSDAAYAKIVDELLQSHAYGEKWARPWLDAARYADTEGYQRDTERSMWPWRDWVIRALNADMPFNQFTIEQLAGDLLPHARLEQKIATGFQRNTPLNLEAGTDPQEDRYKQIVDRVNTLGSVWLGSTLGCAQCHNHKYDPISAKEYYQLFAAFNQTPIESTQYGEAMGMSSLKHIGPEVAIDPKAKKQSASIIHDYTEKMKRFKALVDPQWQALLNDKKRLESFPQSVQDSLFTDPTDRSHQTYERVMKVVFQKDAALKPLWQSARKAHAAVQKNHSPTTRVMQELAEPRPTHIAKRGDFLSLGDKVELGVPAALPALPADAPRNRLGIARWLVSPENPLTPRVTVNRLWAEIFGRGIVPTLEEFGKQGEPPSHPALLDWLAVTFRDTDHWSLKQTLRRIVLSSTYRQSTTYQAQAAELDPLNTLLWRHPGHRLDAETIRDQALFVSSLLNPTAGGPPVYPWQPEGYWRDSAGQSLNEYNVSQNGQQHRRGIYTIWRRGAHYPSFAVFDAPDRASCTLQRGRSSTALQALVLMNDRAYAEMSHKLADRMFKEFTGSVDERLEHGFRTVLSRHPTATEKQQLRSSYDQGVTTHKNPRAGYFDAAHILLNLHETIHRS